MRSFILKFSGVGNVRKMDKSCGFQFQWPFPKNPNALYRLASKATLISVLSACKLIFSLIINKNQLLSALENKSRPLITVSNHRSNMDDPLVWCLFTWREFFYNISRFRYTLAAHNICFTKACLLIIVLSPLIFLVFFFLKKKPLCRPGVYQKGVDFCIEKLAENQWIHVFPEGKVTPTPIRIKWGVARMIMESPNPPILLPIWIHQMAEVWPQSKPYYPRVGKHVIIIIGSKVDMKEHMWRFCTGSVPERRKALADFVQKKLFDLGAEIEQIKL
uniref:Tafazzin family protein n=1 Tax=Elaeophora elaphi TaxID=1147741 RepID=A0A0R3S2M1_9BILA